MHHTVKPAAMCRTHKPVCKLRMGKKPLFKPRGCTTKNGVKVRGKFIESRTADRPVRRKTARPRPRQRRRRRRSPSPSVI